MKNNHYILDGHDIKIVDLMEWAEWFENANRVVKREKLKNGKFVSTVFIGLDHNLGTGEPLLFETMVFPKKGDGNDLDMDRYSTWEEAEKGHKKMVKKWSK